MTGIVDPPADWPVIAGVDPVLTNFPGDVGVNKDVADLLTRNRWIGEHTAWNFHGRVWFDGGRWHERVSVEKQAVASYSAETLEELRKIVNDEHGWA